MIKDFIKVLILVLSLGQLSFADKAQLLARDSDALQARVDIIQQARKEILVEYYSIWNDDESVGGFSLLVKAAQRGVKVKVIMDALFNTVPRSLISALTMRGRGADGEQNLEFKVYNPLSLNILKAAHRDHAKMLIVDDSIMISGGRNVGDKYFGLNSAHNFKDLDVIIFGDIVQQANRNFMQVWNSNLVAEPNLYESAANNLKIDACKPYEDRYEQCELTRQGAIEESHNQNARIESLTEKLSKFSGAKIGLATDSGTDWTASMSEVGSIQFLSHEIGLVNSDNNTMTKQLRDLVKTAIREVQISSPYLVPTEGLCEVLQELVDRGVKVVMITNSIRSTDSLLAHAGYMLGIDRLTAIGVELHEFNGPNTLHAKAAIIDNEIGLIGTYNLDPRSQQKNREVGFAIRGNKKIIDDLNNQFEGMLQNSTLVAKNKHRENTVIKIEGPLKIKVLLYKSLLHFIPFITDQL